MVKSIDWEAAIGRRFRLRDLHVLFAVAQLGSMTQAARQLGVTQSAVSQIVTDLESALGVRLLDRSRRGVELTIYGAILLRRGKAAFGELRQSIQEIESTADPMAGEIRIGCPESISAAILPPIVQAFSKKYSRVRLQFDTVTGANSAPGLRDRSLDLVFARGGRALANLQAADDMDVKTALDDKLVVVAGAHSRWARRRKIDLAELAEEPWIFTPFGWGDEVLPSVFAARGIDMPIASVKTFSIHLRINLVADGPFITALPASVLKLYGERLSLKALPVDLPVRPWSVAIVTLKNRTLSPVVERFIDTACNRLGERRI